MNINPGMSPGVDSRAVASSDDAALMNSAFDYPAIEEMDPSLGEGTIMVTGMRVLEHSVNIVTHPS